MNDYFTIFLAAQLSAITCCLIGIYLNARRQSMMVDVLSHSSLPGIVLAYWIFEGYSSIGILVGAAACSFFTVVAVEKISSSESRVRRDSAMALLFTSMFALGLMMIGFFAQRAHIDIQCALFGDLLFAPFWGEVSLGSYSMPSAVFRVFIVFVLSAVVLKKVHRPLIAASFWGESAKLFGVSSKKMTYILAFLASAAVMVSFELVGVVLVVALFSIPPAFGKLWTSSWQAMTNLSLIYTFLCTSVGLLVGWHWGVNLGGSIAMVLFLSFLISFALYKIKDKGELVHES